MKVFVSGSIAYDIIMDYPGRFADAINLEKIHVLSLSFVLDRAERTYGGTAGNIAYSLALLGVPTELIGGIGKDADELVRHWKKLGIGTRFVKVSKRFGTASCYIMTDRDDNQIDGFYPGAMKETTAKPPVEPLDLAIITPDSGPENMVALARHYQRQGARYIFDPGQQVINFSKAQFVVCLRGASIVIGNDYEIDWMLNKLSLRGAAATKQSPASHGIAAPLAGLGARNDIVIVRTLGPKGSEIIFPNGRKIRIGIAKPKTVVDPTGAGDAYRAGLIKGIAEGLDLKSSAELGATAASFAIEQYGTQKHKFSYNKVRERHNKAFSSKL